MAESAAEKDEEKQAWKETLRQVQPSFRMLAEIVDEGLRHAGLRLEILPRPKTSDKSKGGRSVEANVDVERHGDQVNPGDDGFAVVLEKKIRRCRSQTGRIPRSWITHPRQLTASSL